MHRPRIRDLFLAGLTALGIASEVLAAPQQIKMGTLAPADSPWHRVLIQLGQDWREISGGQVVLRVYPGGVLGDERAMLQKVRVGTLQAMAISGIGLPEIEPGVMSLQIPLMYDSYEELDHVRARIAPILERRIEEKGFVVLNWGDAGWVHFFTKHPARTPDDVRETKLYITAGDAESEHLFKSAGFRPVPLAPTDILSSLQTGVIDAFDTPPLMALVEQWFGLAKNMLDLKWAPLVGATIVDRRAWELIPESQRGRMLDAARKAGERFRGEIRAMNDDAVRAMQERGLNVVRLDDATRALWRREVEAVYPKVRGKMVPADLFDEARRLRDEYRAGATKTRAP